MRRRIGERHYSAALAWPVGSVFISVLETNPAQLLGFGAWTRIANGRAIVGVDEADSDFNAAEKTSGAKTHTLTTNEMPSHTHAVNDPGHSHVLQRFPTTTGGSSGFTADTSMSGTPTDVTQATKSAATGITNTNTGGGAAHLNVQPSLALFIWKRTA